MDTKVYKSENTGSGVVSSTISDSETTEAFLSPLPTNAPGVIVMKPETAEEEHIHFTGKDSGAGKITGLTRDYDNRNGGSGYEHLSGSSWEILVNAEDRNNMVDAIMEGYWEEWNNPTYASSTTFTVAGDQTGIYTRGRIVRFNQDNTKVGIVVSSVYSSSTTVTVENVTVPNPITSLEVGIQPKTATGQSDVYYVADTASDDDYEVALSPALGAYTTGLMIAFKAVTKNTGACTLNVDSLGTKSLKIFKDQDPPNGFIKAGSIVLCVYDGTNFQILNVQAQPGVERQDTATDGATVTFDLSKAKRHKVVLGGNRTLALSNEETDQIFILELVQDGTGSRTVTWFSTISWAGGIAPTLTTTAGKSDVFGFIVTGSGTYQGFVIGQNV